MIGDHERPIYKKTEDIKMNFSIRRKRRRKGIKRGKQIYLL